MQMQLPQSHATNQWVGVSKAEFKLNKINSLNKYIFFIKRKT